jgi:phage terminase small subunit
VEPVKPRVKRWRPLTAMQKAFIGEYLVDLNAGQAAIRAGYSAKTAYNIGPKTLSLPDVAAGVQAEMDKRAKKVGLSAASVLRDIELVKNDAMQLITDRGGNRTMINPVGALKALELQGRHLKLFTDKVEHSGPDGGPITQVLRTIVDSK